MSDVYHAYPDVSVVCPPVEGSADDLITNPVLLVLVPNVRISGIMVYGLSLQVEQPFLVAKHFISD